LATDHERAATFLQKLRHQHGDEKLRELLLPSEDDVSPRVANSGRIDPEAVERRWGLIEIDGAREQLLDSRTVEQMESYGQNIENFIGTVKVPVGLAGPLRVQGLFARGDYYVPLATSEAALVASYTRGAQALSDAGGVTSIVVNEGVGRSPVFCFANLREAGEFIIWMTDHLAALKAAAEGTTRHGKLVDIRFTLEGANVYVLFEFTTGDAAGQNMVTIATDAICRHIAEHTPVKPNAWYVEANMSGDKKASAQSYQGVRGKKVVAECVLPAELVQRRLRTTAKDMIHYYRTSAMGAVLSGTLGINGHYANGLAALYIACGQDAACVAESAVGITRFDQVGDDVYVSVTLPNLIVGTVGGGTRLPSQNACLQIMGMAGAGHANAFAEVAAALLLAGEVSIIAALSAGHFAGAHQKLARGPK
jgi:hydroxymethylglutaryl-CoA reductase (NADPH)